MTTAAVQSFKARALEAYEREIGDLNEQKRIDWFKGYEAARVRIARQFTDRIGIPREPTDVQLLDSDAPFPEMQRCNSESDGADERPYTVWVEDVRFVAFSGGALYVVNTCGICHAEWLARTDHDIADIGMRMLEPHELLKAQFGAFAVQYDLSAARTKTAKVRLIGNSVCPEQALAVVRVNRPRPIEVAA
jgi:hypothetical protein